MCGSGCRRHDGYGDWALLPRRCGACGRMSMGLSGAAPMSEQRSRPLACWDRQLFEVAEHWLASDRTSPPHTGLR